MQKSLFTIPQSECASEDLQLPTAQASKSEEATETRKQSPILAKSNQEDDARDNHDTITLCKSFEDMGLHDEVLHGIYSFGFTQPSKIQQQAILPCLQGRDVVVQAQSGTGKTATFTISVLQQLDIGKTQCQALILSPTKELARQTYTVMLTLGDYLDIEVLLAIGGESVSQMRQKLARGVHVVVGTPGRVKHMLEERALDPKDIKILVLDEVDIMLSRGFEEQVRDIFTELPRKVQSISVSATLPPEALKMMDKFMIDPLKILLPPEEVSLAAIQQFYVDVEHDENKYLTLCDIYETLSVPQSIIFCNTKKRVEQLASFMTEQHFTVSCIHGEQSTDERRLTLKEFRDGASRVLIATDVLQRGIDIQQVALVCNMDLPWERESYIHRIGRCGRFGRKGVAISLVTRRDFSSLKALEREYSMQISEMPMDIANYLQ